MMASVDDSMAKRYGLVHSAVVQNIMAALGQHQDPAGIKGWILKLRNKILSDAGSI